MRDLQTHTMYRRIFNPSKPLLNFFAKSAISQSLTWTHYLNLMRIEKEAERSFYEIKTVKNNWSVRKLQRQLDPELYNRLTLSRHTKKVQELSEIGLIFEYPKLP